MYLKATLGAFNVAATVDKVDVQGEGQSHMTLSSPLLPALNRQLQFVTYTNTVFHPKTADTGKQEDQGLTDVPYPPGKEWKKIKKHHRWVSANKNGLRWLWPKKGQIFSIFFICVCISCGEERHACCCLMLTSLKATSVLRLFGGHIFIRGFFSQQFRNTTNI